MQIRKIVIVPDSFKGTLSSSEICRIVGEAAKEILPAVTVVAIPVADGGEGSVDCFLSALGGEKITCRIKGPYFEDTDAFFARLPDGKTAVIEMAAAAGLPLVGKRKNPMLTSTYGVGQLIECAVHSGCEQIILGLGGSATNDGGCGMAAALGVRFFDDNDEEMLPVGGTLGDVARIDRSSYVLPPTVQITAMCDIDNPLTGPNGASFVFAPQKGASPDMCVLLDAGMDHLAKVIQSDLSCDVTTLPGGGAAGGMGAGAVAFLGAQLHSGIETVLNVTDFDRALDGCDLIITGEGRLDSQSCRGKVISGIADRAQARDIPLIVLTGCVGEENTPLYQVGVSAVFSINRQAERYETAKYKTRENLRNTALDLFRLCRSLH